MITTKFGGERNLKIGRPCLSLMGCIVTLTSTVFFRPTPGRVDPEDKDSEHIFTLYFNMTIYRVVILIHEEYELDLSRGEFVKLVGFKETVLKEKKQFCGENGSGYHKKCWLGVSPLQSDHTASKRCWKQCPF